MVYAYVRVKNSEDLLFFKDLVRVVSPSVSISRYFIDVVGDYGQFSDYALKQLIDKVKKGDTLYIASSMNAYKTDNYNVNSRLLQDLIFNVKEIDLCKVIAKFVFNNNGVVTDDLRDLVLSKKLMFLPLLNKGVSAYNPFPEGFYSVYVKYKNQELKSVACGNLLGISHTKFLTLVKRFDSEV